MSKLADSCRYDEQLARYRAELRGLEAELDGARNAGDRRLLRSEIAYVRERIQIITANRDYLASIGVVV